ncbi:hypothetical protein AB4Z46_34675 [Variovorax sp. M-6]|uniref:hypothetical protein n=1 Tax=Variovorax sp. M-6 TaxID=3233041 RepID=UPI003F9E67DF
MIHTNVSAVLGRAQSESKGCLCWCEAIIPAKPVLRELVVQFDIGLVHGRGSQIDTRQPGTLVI